MCQAATPSAILLPELVLALVGHTGDVFVMSEPTTDTHVGEPDCPVSLADDLTWVSAPERCVLI